MEHTNAQRREHEAHLTFAGAPEEVFPLLCPVKEYDWIEDWDCDVVFTASGVAERGCIFRTGGERDEIWTVSRYEPGVAIEFVRVRTGVWVVITTIELAPGEKGTTAVTWRQVFTALSKAGEQAVEEFSVERHDAHMRRLETEANHYLTTGTMLRRSAQPTGV
jgi:hypothetical protein